MAVGPIERNFIPHSTTLARGRMSGNRWREGVGDGLGRFFVGKRPSGLRWVRKTWDRSLARSREGAKGAKGMGEVWDMIYMIYMIFVGLWLGLGRR